MPRGFAPSKKDANHDEVVTTLSMCGWKIADVHAVGGVPDLFVSKRGITIAVEVKNGKGKQTAAELEFWADWSGEKLIVHSGEEAFNECEKILDCYRTR